jgi:hypothetical protein
MILLSIENVKVGLKVKATPELVQRHIDMPPAYMNADTVITITNIKEETGTITLTYTNLQGEPMTGHVAVEDYNLFYLQPTLTTTQRKSIDNLLNSFPNGNKS